MTEPDNQAEALDADELDTIETIARNDQTGRITPYEVRELLRGYRAYLASLPEAPVVPVVKALSVDEIETIILATEPSEMSDHGDRIWTRRMAVGLSKALAALASQPAVEGEAVAWIVGNGDGTMWRMWTIEGPIWTWDRDRATRYARRVDAESVHAEDEGAWTVVPYSEPSTHDWFTYKNMECCQKCGNVRNETSDSRPCKGRVSVGLRDPCPAAADAGVWEALPATGPYVDRIIRIFRDRPDDDTSAVVLQDYARASLSLAAKRGQAE